jgi:hypothetical protein
MAAIIKIDQAGLPAGVAGKSRSDGLATGALVTITSTGGGAAHSLELLWVPDTDATVVASLIQTTPTTWTFAPQAARYGTYRIRLTVDGERNVRTFSIRTPNRGMRIPALNEVASKLATLPQAALNPAALAALRSASEFNEDLGGSVPFAAGNWGGWYSALAHLIMVVDGIVGGGPPALHAPTHAAQTGTDPLATAAAGAIAIGDTADVGTAETFARSDHRHSLDAPALPAMQVVGVGATGAAPEPARADHVHPMDATDAVDVVYGPTTPGDWYAPDPVNVEEALDRLAKLRALTITSFSATPNFDFTGEKNWHQITLTANITAITFSDPRQIGTVVLKFVQGGAGGYTVTGWPGSTRWAGGVKPTFGDAVGTTRLVTAWYDGSVYHCEFRPETYIA